MNIPNGYRCLECEGYTSSDGETSTGHYKGCQTGKKGPSLPDDSGLLMRLWEKMGRRFGGADLRYRTDRSCGPWVAEVTVTGSEAGGSRVVAKGFAWRDAVCGVLSAVEMMDLARRDTVAACGKMSKARPGIPQVKCERDAGHVGDHESFRSGVYWSEDRTGEGVKP